LIKGTREHSEYYVRGKMLLLKRVSKKKGLSNLGYYTVDGPAS
jgi:hypothetical protein